jgi:hypothetical protein
LEIWIDKNGDGITWKKIDETVDIADLEEDGDLLDQLMKLSLEMDLYIWVEQCTQNLHKNFGVRDSTAFWVITTICQKMEANKEKESNDLFTYYMNLW